MDRTCQKLMKFVKFARDLSELSCCKAKQCGAVVFPYDFSAVYALGYNGPPIGQPNDACTAPVLQAGELARCGCVHAEANLCAKLGHVEQCMMYVTTSPCPHCAGIIANARRIADVVYTDPYWTLQGNEILLAAGIGVWDIREVLGKEGLLRQLTEGHACLN